MKDVYDEYYANLDNSGYESRCRVYVEYVCETCSNEVWYGDRLHGPDVRIADGSECGTGVSIVFCMTNAIPVIFDEDYDCVRCSKIIHAGDNNFEALMEVTRHD